MNKPTVAVYKFSSCDGCQLSILNLEDELLDLVGGGAPPNDARTL
jgi:coenzyme F420-reducing hydrogenase gamma subunit